MKYKSCGKRRMEGGSRLAGQQHNDVLDANPENEAQKNALLDEIKRRGNAAFKAGSLREAEILYSRGITLESSDLEVKKAFYSNRSMTYSKMGVFEKAKVDAEKLIAIDSSFSKGYYRMAVALKGLKSYAESISNFEKVIELEPTNKSVQEELRSVLAEKEVFLREQERLKTAENGALEENEEPKIIKKVVEKSDNKVENGKKNDNKNKSEEADGIDYSMRGYRTTKDGRKTTYFNTERTEEDLKLIGEIKPKKLVETEMEIEQKLEAVKETKGSVWNEGGTFEEKDLNEWARKRLQDILLSIKHKSTSTSDKSKTLLFTVKKVTDLEGDASVTFTRGKKRKIFDFNFKLEITVDCENTSSEKEDNNIELALFLPEFSGDIMTNGDEIEVEVLWNNREKAGEFKEHIWKNLKDINGEFRTVLNNGLKKWFDEFTAL